MSASTGIRTRSRITNQLGSGKSKNNEKSGSKVTAKLDTANTRSRLTSRLMDVTNKENDSSIRQRPSRSRTRSAKGKPRDQSKTVENERRLTKGNSPKSKEKETRVALSSSEPASSLKLRNKSVNRLSASHKQQTEINSKENTAAIEPRLRPTRLKKPTYISKESWGSIPKKQEVVKKPESPKEPRQNKKKVSPQKSPSTRSQSTKVLRSAVKKGAVEKPSAKIKSPEKTAFVSTRSRRMSMLPVLPKAKDKVQKPAMPTVNASRKPVTRQKTFPEAAMSGKRSATKTSDSKLQQMMAQIPVDEIQLKDFSIVLENFDKSLLPTDESVAVEKSPEKTVSDVEIQPRNFSIVLEKLDLSTLANHEILQEEKSPKKTVPVDENKSRDLRGSKESKEPPETPFEDPENVSLKELSNKENLVEKDTTTKKPLTTKEARAPVIQRLRVRKMSVFVESRKSVKRPRDSTETELKPVAKKRVVIQSPVKEPIRTILPFRRLLEVQEEKEETEADSDDVYDFRMSQPVYPENKKRKKANPVKRLNNNKTRNKKTNAGSKLQNLIQQNALKFAVNSCVVMHNPDQFKKEKEKVQKSLKTGQKNNIPKINLVESDIADLAKEIKLPQRKAPQNLSVNTTKTRTPPHTVQRRLNMNSPGPDLNNDEMEAILSENHLNLPKNPAITKIVEPTKRASLVFSPKIVSSPKVIASPFRVNDEIKFPRTFYFSLTKDNMPSYSSDPLMENPDKGQENSVPANNTIEKSKEPEILPSENPVDNIMPSCSSDPLIENPVDNLPLSSDPLIENLDKSPDEAPESPAPADKTIENYNEPEVLQSEKSADLFVTASEIDESTINNSNMENIAPPSKIIPKSPEKFGILKNPTRSPLKALMIEGLFEERIPQQRTPFLSPLAVFSSTGNPAKENVVIISNETITKPGHQSNSQITEDFSDNALENRDSTSAQQPDSISKTSAESRNLEEVDKIDKKGEGVSSDASDVEDFGFDDLMDENNRDSGTVDPQPRLSLEAIKEKLSSLKKYLPSKQKNTSGEKKNQSEETSPSLLAPSTTKLFTSPTKRLQDIREMFTSTPNQAIAMKNRKKISFGGESLRPSSSFALEEPSETQNTVTEEASAVDENSEVPTQIELFDDPANTTEFSVSRDFLKLVLEINHIISFRICTKATRGNVNLHSWT